MSGTMSSSSPEWVQFYQHNISSGHAQPTAATRWSGDVVSDSTVVTTTNASSTSSTIGAPLGRVSKPTAQRRRRASRRTPTTLLNTDTANFRAMVQQFTGGGGVGGPAATPFISNASGTNTSTHQYLGGYNNSNSYNFGVSATSSVAAPPAGGYNVQFRQANDGQQYYMLSRSDGHGGPSSTHGDHHQTQALFERLGNYSSGPAMENNTSNEIGGENYMF